MPIYEYKCNECGMVIEHLKKSNDEVVKCICGNILNDSHKVFPSNVIPHFKGTGFYETDYKLSKKKED